MNEKEFFKMASESRLGRKWLKWHRLNPEFYRLFEKYSLQALSNGHLNLSGWLIANRVRWESSIVTRGNDYKISNDFIALFTRLFMINNPQYIGFFKTKPMKRLVREPALFRTSALGDFFEGEPNET